MSLSSAKRPHSNHEFVRTGTHSAKVGRTVIPGGGGAKLRARLSHNVFPCSLSPCAPVPRSPVGGQGIFVATLGGDTLRAEAESFSFATSAPLGSFNRGRRWLTEKFRRNKRPRWIQGFLPNSTSLGADAWQWGSPSDNGAPCLSWRLRCLPGTHPSSISPKADGENWGRAPSSL